MKKYLEYKDEKSHKFWQIEVEENSFTVTYGKVGTKGQSKTKEFDNAKKANQEAEKIIKQKNKKGYKEVTKTKNNVFKLSTKAQQALQVLENWEEKNTVFNFEKIYTVAYFHKPKIANCCYLMNLDDDFKAIINKQFYEIAETGEGGTYALWNYPELQGEPPVIYFETDGDFKMVAASLEAFASMFALDEYLEKEGYVDFQDICEYYDLNDDDEAKKLFKKAVKQYQKTISSLFKLKALEEYLIDMNQHKNFTDWYTYIEENGKDTKGKIGGNYHIKQVINKENSTIDLTDYIELIDLLITDTKVINTIEKLGIKLPAKIKKDTYEIDDYEDELGLRIGFDKKNYDGKLLLDYIVTWKRCECKYPFNITKEDTYQQIVDKIGKPAIYSWKYAKNSRIWTFTNKNNIHYKIQVSFGDEDLATFESFMIEAFNPNDISRSYLELK